jgi:hypothetical protein
MTGAYVQIHGVEQVRAALQRLTQGTQAMRDTRVLVGSPLKYAFGIETGRHRGGGLARRAGGAFYLRGAVQSVMATAGASLAPALLEGAQATVRALTRLGYDVQREAQMEVPVRTGTLRRSIHTVVGRRA